MKRAKSGRNAPSAVVARRAGKPAVKTGRSTAYNSRGGSPAGFDLSEIRQLIRLVQRTGIGELEVSVGGRTVRVSAQPGTSGVPPAVVTTAPVGSGAPATATAETRESEHLQPITSPMVGTFYRAPAPDADPYVESGAVVEIGQTVCIIEAMKLMNEIESEVKGRIVQILVENAQPVEFGQKLFLVEPA